MDFLYDTVYNLLMCCHVCVCESDKDVQFAMTAPPHSLNTSLELTFLLHLLTFYTKFCKCFVYNVRWCDIEEMEY